MGSGKSSIGILMAKKLNAVLIDIDKEIEKMQNQKISQIFELKGEAYFRELEFNVTIQSLKDNNKIISLGGGAFLNKELRKIIKNESSTFWLYWNSDTLIKRIKNNYSDYKIICENLKKSEIVDKILQKCKKNEIVC